MDPRAKALSELARFQVASTTVGDALHRIAEITLDAVPAADVAGMTVLGEDGRPTTAIYTDPRSPAIDEAQYREGTGPCLDAWRTKDVFRVDDIDTVTHQYPGFSAACRDHGVFSTLSVPLVNGDASIGALNLYAHARAAFGTDDETLVQDLAGAAGVMLGNVSAYWAAFDLGYNLEQAMRSRAVIEQAKGILMARKAELTADEAFDLLRKASQRENVKLRVIAQRVVDRRAPGQPSSEAPT
jgi:transcriptional regulator with GAF, ATPase, and Fis domain